MTNTTNAIAKVAAIAAVFALATSVVAPAAHADTTTTTTTSAMTATQVTALQNQIASLQAQLSGAQGTTTSTGSMTFTRSLTLGSSGADVTALQNWLVSKGYTIPAGATGYFGAQTKAAVAAYQSAKGISPAAGYFGPTTRASVNAMGGTTTTTTTTTGAGCVAGAAFSSTTGMACGTTTTTGGVTLSGTEGTINNFQTVGASNVTLGTGASQQVYGFRFQAGGSDLAVSRIYFDVGNTSASGTSRPWNVFQNATLTDGSGKTIATVDATNASNWSQDGTVPSGAGAGNQIYRIAFENTNQVVKMDQTQMYYLTLSTQGSFATGNSGGSYEVTLASQGLRATDAAGIQQYTPSSTGSFPANGSTVTVNANATGTVTLSTGSDNPQTTTVAGNQNTVKMGVVLNTFTLANTGNADLTLYSLPVTLTVTGSGGQAANLIQDLKLYQGSTLLDTESPSTSFGTTGSVNFKNIGGAAGMVIAAGTTDRFSVVADIQPVGGSNPAPEGSSATVTIPGTNTDIEAAGGAIITPTGTSSGHAITFVVNGLTIDSAPAAGATWNITTAGNGTQQTGTYNFSFSVAAFGQDIYVSSTSANGVLPVTLYDQAGNATTTQAVTISSGADRSTLGNFVVHSGDSKTFIVGFTKQGQNGVVQAKLTGLKYGTTDANPLSSTYSLPSAYQSSQQFLAD